MPEIDADETNELGLGLIDPDREAWLIRRGIVYARRRTFVDERGKECTYIRCSKRPIGEVYEDLLNRWAPRRPAN